MQIYKVGGHADSLLPEGDWDLVWQDEFDGKELDRTKWDYRMNIWGMEQQQFTKNGVALDGNSHLVFTLIEEDGKPVATQLQTGYNFMDAPVKKTKFQKSYMQWPIGKLQDNLYTKKFGYFECRARLQQKRGWWPAFWMQSPIIGASNDPALTGVEIDIMESFRPGKVTGHNIYTGGYGQDLKRVQVGGKFVNQQCFHNFGVAWDETGYTFYIDGVEDGRVEQHISHIPEFILLSCEPKGYRDKDHKPTDEAIAAIGDTFVVDFVRVFDRKK